MAEFLEAVTLWWNLLLALLVFGFAPGFCLRLIVRVYPRSDPRRAELIAELYAVPRVQRPLWVAEQLEVALFEGLRHRVAPLSRRHARRIERMRQANDQLLALRVQSVLVECGLTRVDFSIGGGRTLRTPHVTSVVAGPPVRLTIRPLPGQTPDDFARHAPAIAHHLGVAEIRVVMSGSSLIGLELLPRPG